MQNQEDLLPQLEKLLKQKRSKEFYAEKLNISTEEVDKLLKDIRKEEETEETIEPNLDPSFMGSKTTVNVEKGILQSQVRSNQMPQTFEELAQLHKIDLNKYKVSKYGINELTNGDFTSSVVCTSVKTGDSLQAQKQVILEQLKDEFPVLKLRKKDKSQEQYAYEIDVFDPHFGKLSWGDEAGEDYDLDIATKRYEETIAGLLEYINVSKVEKIIFPIGNDMINIDSRKNETFAGTRQDSDSRFFKIIRTVKEILIRTINTLSQLAPVDILVIGGNHDPESMFMMGEILDAYYHNDENVSVDNRPRQRKYYKYGRCGFQYTHGNEENHKDLGLIFATEEPHLWADTEFRFAKLGHFHKNKKTSYLSVDEHQGFQVQVIPSLSGSDAWHTSRGYNSKKQAKAFLYHKDRGQIAEFSYTV